MQPTSNRLLDGLPPDVRCMISRDLEWVTLSAGDVLQQIQAPLDHAYFPVAGVLSVIARSGSGEGEIGMIGREGTTALPLLFGSERASQKVVVQMGGEAFRVGAGKLRSAIADHAGLRSVLLRYAQYWSIQVGQTSLANARNTVRERLSRWLLMCQDRTGSSDLAITHEALAATLAVRRPGVTVATHELEGDGSIRARRGLIRITDRQKLTADARCYGEAESEYERLLGRPLPSAERRAAETRHAA